VRTQGYVIAGLLLASACSDSVPSACGNDPFPNLTPVVPPHPDATITPPGDGGEPVDAGPSCNAPATNVRNLTGHIIDIFAAGSLVLQTGNNSSLCHCNLFTLANVVTAGGVPNATACHDRFNCDYCASEDPMAGYTTIVPLGPNAHVKFCTHGPAGTMTYDDSCEVAEVIDVLFDGTVINFDPGDQWRYVVSDAIVQAAATAAGVADKSTLLMKGFGIISTDICAFSGNRYGLSPNITFKVTGAAKVFKAGWDAANMKVTFTEVMNPGTASVWAFPLGFYVGDGTPTSMITISAQDLMDPSPPLVYSDLTFANTPGKVIYARPNTLDDATTNGGCLTRFH
jgi:hypothetical protein